MAITSLIIAIILLGFGVYMFIAPDTVLMKFNLTRNIARMIALGLAVIGAWFGLSYYGERKSIALAEELKKQLLALQLVASQNKKETTA